MSTKPTPAFTTIDPSALEAVTGGATKAALDERILDKIVSLTTAVADVAAQQSQQKPDPMASIMPFLMMKMMKGGNTGGGLF